MKSCEVFRADSYKLLKLYFSSVLGSIFFEISVKVESVQNIFNAFVFSSNDLVLPKLKVEDTKLLETKLSNIYEMEKLNSWVDETFVFGI